MLARFDTGKDGAVGGDFVDRQLSRGEEASQSIIWRSERVSRGSAKVKTRFEPAETAVFAANCADAALGLPGYDYYPVAVSGVPPAFLAGYFDMGTAPPAGATGETVEEAI